MRTFFSSTGCIPLTPLLGRVPVPASLLLQLARLSVELVLLPRLLLAVLLESVSLVLPVSWL